MAIFNPNRKQGGTIELVRDAQGNYTTREVGFNTLASLSIPDFKTTTTPTTTTTDTKTATDVTGDTIDTQTQMAFQMPDRDDNQMDTTGSMLQEARKTSGMLADTFDSPEMRRRDEAKITSPLDIQSPTERVFDRPNMREVAGDRRMTAEEAAPQENILSDVSLKDPAVTSANVQRGAVEAPGINFDFLKGDRFKQGTPSTDAAARAAMTSDAAMRGDAMTQQEIPDRNRGQLGVRTAKPAETALDMDRFEGVSRMGTLADKDVKDVKPVKRNALETVSTSLKSAFQNIKTPTMMVLDAITPDPTAVNKHDTSYFTDRGDGRIGGNPATDLYAGFNRVSAFGNLEKAGEKRIARREKTIATKNVSQKFIDDTNRMKEQQANYKASLDKNVTTKREAARMNQPGSGGDTSGRSGKSIVCTAMYQTTGLEDWKKAMKIWYIYQKKYLTIQHQEGYHKLFKPFVKGMHKSKIIKAIGAHVAKHRTQHLKHVMFNSKSSLLGKVYNKILEPICYWVGKI